MVYALLDPGVFLTSEEDWQNTVVRDTFLDRLNGHLEFIENLDVGRVIWCNELDEIIWSCPQKPPWKASKNWNIGLTMILYKFLTKNTLKVQLQEKATCQVNPLMVCICMNSLEVFLKMVSEVLCSLPSAHFCPSPHNHSDSPYRFRRNTSEEWRSFPVVREPSDWPKAIFPCELYWPTGRTEADVLRKCIEYMALSKDIDTKTLHSFSFTPRFIDEVTSASRKTRVAEMIVLRLSKTTQEATGNTQLQDEVLSDGTRRFRVTPRPSSLRVHYIIENGDLVFQRFFDKGHHDNGL